MRGRALACCTLLLASGVCCSNEQRALEGGRCDEDHAARRPGEIRVAGSGTNLAPATHIAALYERAHSGTKIVVAQSIGTGGAIRALGDRAIEVGLASRSLTDEERSVGLSAHPFARVALAPAVHQRVGREAIGIAELASLYRGDTETWSDGTAVVPILRQPGDSTTRAIEASSPELGAAMLVARKSGRALTRFTDQEVRDTLLRVPGAIGFLDAGTIALEELPLMPLALDGVRPTAESVDSGRYPLVLTLSLLTRDDASPAVRALVAFATSPEIAAALAPAGYAPARAHAKGGE